MNAPSWQSSGHPAPSLPDLDHMLHFIADVVRAVECTGQRTQILAMAPLLWRQGLQRFRQAALPDRLYGGILVLEAVLRTPDAFPIILDYLVAECERSALTA